ncbi:MAG TPA: hypothetical protein VJS91_03560, partial [Nitrososphaeraceae archaeon]|nr:hypothetical protein [Nitrososphaeraceae archaeon]
MILVALDDISLEMFGIDTLALSTCAITGWFELMRFTTIHMENIRMVTRWIFHMLDQMKSM